MSDDATQRPAQAVLPLTPSQTVGPFLHIALPWPDGPDVVPEGTPGAIRIAGRIVDGAGEPVGDALVETWQADPEGRFVHPDDPRGDSPARAEGFRGFGRCPTDADGSYEIRTLLPGALPAPDGEQEAPHLDVSVFARGLLDRLVTRVYFPDEPANDGDPVLRAVPADRRATLVAEQVDDSTYRFDIVLQGAGETVFFDV
jgi:protocatechuate 3,4-dioxygenase alpha subunit